MALRNAAMASYRVKLRRQASTTRRMGGVAFETAGTSR
jgi:hypothetical protein